MSLVRFGAVWFLLICVCARCLAQTPPTPVAEPLWLREMLNRGSDEEDLLCRGPASAGCDSGCGSYGLDTAYHIRSLFGDPDSGRFSAGHLEREALLALPLMTRTNAPQVFLRGNLNLMTTFVKRIALRPLRKLPPIQPPTGEIAIDTHIHTTYSPDSLADVTAVLLRASRRGLAGVAITDHNAFDGARVAQKISERLIAEHKVSPGFFVIPGEEVSSSDGHVIALFLNHLIEPGMSAKQTVDAIHAQDGIAIAAHPEMEHSLGDLAKTLPFDAVETLNAAEEMHFALAGKDRQDRRDAFYSGVTKPRIGSSDAHDPATIGTCYTLVACEPTLESVREALKAGRTTPMMGMTSEEENALVHGRLSHVLLSAESVKDPTGKRGKSSRAPDISVNYWPALTLEFRWLTW